MLGNVAGNRFHNGPYPTRTRAGGDGLVVFMEVK